MNRRDDRLDFLNERRSVPARLLAPPGPSGAELEVLLGTALRVPDHGKLAPWRFVLLEGEHLRQFGEWQCAHHKRLEPELPAALAAKDIDRYRHAPCVVVLVASLQSPHKVPECEQWLSVGCAGFSVLLAAQAMGYGAQWLTGWAAYDPEVMRYLGLHADERIAGFLHIGSAVEPAPERLRPSLSDKLTRWSAPR
jgi:nitroreductase